MGGLANSSGACSTAVLNLAEGACVAGRPLRVGDDRHCHLKSDVVYGPCDSSKLVKLRGTRREGQFGFGPRGCSAVELVRGNERINWIVVDGRSGTACIDGGR